MTKLAVLIQKRPYVMALICVCLPFLGVVAWASARSWVGSAPKGLQIEPRIINSTKALKVVEVKQENEASLPIVKITIVNVSNKNIGAYVLTMGGLKIISDTAIAGKFIVPGETKTEKISLNNLNHSRPGEIVVSAVYFEDHTGEGDARQVKDIANHHQGFKEQIERILPILRVALNNSQNAEATLNLLESKASELPAETKNSMLSANYRSGLSFGKKGFQGKIKRLKAKKEVADDFNFRAELTELIATYEQILLKL